MYYDKDRVLSAIWADPSKATGLNFTLNGRQWQSRQRPDGTDGGRADKTVLKRQSSGQIYMHYNGGSFPTSQDIFSFLEWKYNTNDFAEAIELAAESYSIQPEAGSYGAESEELRKAREQRATDRKILPTVTKIILQAIDGEAGKPAGEYLKTRSLTKSGRMGAYSRNIRAQILQALEQEYPGTTDKDLQAMLRRYFPTVRKDHSKSAQGEWVDFADSYALCFPYYNGTGNVAGYCLRQTSPAKFTDGEGRAQEMPKYIFSKDMAKGGYCQTLSPAEPVYLVEGIIDAERMAQAGFANVMALGGTAPTDSAEDAAKSQIKTLQRYGAKHLYYIPDLEYNEDGTEKTEATEAAINVLRPHLTGKLAGKGFRSLRIVHLSNSDRKSKEDADSFIAEQGAQAMQEAINAAPVWYAWAMQQAYSRNAANTDDMATAAIQVYCSIDNPIDRGQLRTALRQAPAGSVLAQMREAGVTPAALSQIDRQGDASTYRQRITAAVGELQDAVQKHATADTIGGLLSKAQRVQNGTAAGFGAQVNITEEQLHSEVMLKPKPLETGWKLWQDGGTKVTECRRISFSPANISVIAAPTSHGKTLLMLQTALYLAQTYRKHILYISLENDTEQLYIRALSAYIGGRCKEWASVQNPRRVLREHIRGEQRELFDDERNGLDLDAQISAYWREIAPSLHLVRGGRSAEELFSNISAQVEEWQEAGEEAGGIFIDYMQLLHLAGKTYSRTDEMKMICDSLNDLAKTTGQPVIVGSQMNRDATKNNGDGLDGVQLANLGESSGIENIAEDCYMIWNTDRLRDEVYMSADGRELLNAKKQPRSARCYRPEGGGAPSIASKRTGCIYVESLKARDYAIGCYCLLPVNFSTGSISTGEDSAKH